jgi:hypothetical protein
MKKNIRKFISLVLALALSLTVCIPAFAATNNNSYINNQYLEAAEKLSSYVAKNADGTLYLKDEAKSIDIGSDNYDAILTSIKTVNSMISQGYLVSDLHGKLTVTTKYVGKVQVGKNGYVKANKDTLTVFSNTISTKSIQMRASSTGVNKIVWQWYGFDIYMDNARTIQVAGGIGLAAVAAVYVPEPALSKALAAALGATGVVIGMNNTNGKGVIIKFENIVNPSGLPVPTPFWISAQ